VLPMVGVSCEPSRALRRWSVVRVRFLRAVCRTACRLPCSTPWEGDGWGDCVGFGQVLFPTNPPWESRCVWIRRTLSESESTSGADLLSVIVPSPATHNYCENRDNNLMFTINYQRTNIIAQQKHAIRFCRARLLYQAWFLSFWRILR
jgi:hypothetical protein